MEASYVIRLSPEQADECEKTLEELDSALQARGLGEVAGKANLAGTEVIFFIDLENHLDRPILEQLLKESGLAAVTSLEEPEEADDDDWDDDEDDEFDDDADLDDGDYDDDGDDDLDDHDDYEDGEQ